MADTGKSTMEVRFENNGIAVVCMRRGENRVNNEFLLQFNQCLDTIERTPSCVGVVTTGEGKFFSNGLDTDWLATLDEGSHATFRKTYDRLLGRLLTFPLPTAAAINGHCYAAGLLIAVAHDLRVMNSERGWLCLNEVFINKRFSLFMLKLLRAKINPTALHPALVLGQRFTGPEAASANVVNAAVAPSLLKKKSHHLLQSFIGKAGFPRDHLHTMKMDLYADVIKEQNQAKM